MKILQAVMVVASALLVSCSGDPPREFPGSRVFQVRMDSDLVSELLSGARSGVELPASVVIDRREYPIEISAAGLSTIESPKKSFNLEFKEERFEGAEEIRLSASVDDPSMLRPFLGFEILSKAGLAVPAIEPAVLYLNERLMGLYHRMERIDSAFLAKRGIPSKVRYKAEVEADFKPDMASRIDEAFSVRPQEEGLGLMLILARIHRLASDEEFSAQVFRILDRDAVVQYLVGTLLVNHYDGFNKNLQLIRRDDTGRLHPLPWDLDRTWHPDHRENLNPWDINRLFDRIVNLPLVRAEIRAQAQALLATTVTDAWIRERTAFWTEQVRSAYEADPFFRTGNRHVDAESAKFLDEVLTWSDRVRNQF